MFALTQVQDVVTFLVQPTVIPLVLGSSAMVVYTYLSVKERPRRR